MIAICIDFVKTWRQKDKKALKYPLGAPWIFPDVMATQQTAMALEVNTQKNDLCELFLIDKTKVSKTHTLFEIKICNKVYSHIKWYYLYSNEINEKENKRIQI